MTRIAGAIVVLAGLRLIGLAALILIVPAHAKRFLRSFAR